jgi:hypothetical protein
MAEHKLFVGGLSWNTDDDGLWNAFSKVNYLQLHNNTTTLL